MDEQWVSDLLRGFPMAIVVLIFSYAAISAARQHIANERTKLKLALFEKRHEIFYATWKFLSDLVQKDPVTSTDIYVFSTKTASAKFLFGDDIVEFLDEAMMKGIQLGTAESALSRPASEETYNAVHAERHKLVIWAENELKQVQNRFKPYLALSEP